MNRIICLISIVTMLSGCTAVPSFDEEDDDSLSGLSAMVKCQTLTAFQSVSPKPPFDLDKWYVTYVISKKSKETAGVGVDPFAWVIPANIDKLILHSDIAASRVATRNAKVEYSSPLNSPYRAACSGSPKQTVLTKPIDFKVGTWAKQLAVAGTEPQSFGYTVDVVVTTAASLHTELANGRVSGTGGIRGERETTRTIDFAFSKAPSVSGSRVYITNWPTGVVPAPSGNIPRAGRKPVSAPVSNQIPAEVIQQNRSILQQLQIDRIDRNR